MESDDTVVPADTIPTVDRPAHHVSGGGAGSSRYKFGEMIGRGGMGEVVSARDEQIGRTVAVKRLRNASPEAIARFLREAHVQGRLEHPAVVPVHELSHDERGPFFVMKQLHGVTLNEVIDKLAAKDPEAIAKYTRQRLLRDFAEICLAIEFAHTKGVVHRDLKPANIVLGEFGEVYVLDWGIARVLHETESFEAIDGTVSGETQVGAVLGTPGYMSPEQVTGDESLDGRADVYSLGCILFEILALVPLHPRGMAGLATAISGVDARPSKKVDGIPPELDAACTAAVAMSRDARVASARALGDLVQRFLDGDRDLELRRELARTELAAAYAATDSKLAMQAAARALALDPTSREPAELVGRLMLEPPKVVPPEVEKELEAMDLEALWATKPLLTATALSYLFANLLLYWIGFRDWPYFIGGSILCLATAWVGAFGKNRHVLIGTALVCNLVMLAWLGRLVNPFLIVPGLGVILIMATVAHPRYIRAWTIVPLTGASLLVPYILERVGVLTSLTSVSGDAVELHTTATELAVTPVKFVLPVMVLMMFASAGILAASQARARRVAQHAAQVQKWQLRQLMPG